MKIINKQEFLQNKEFYIKEINNGKIFIYPTDTIYGIGCDTKNSESIKKLREIKQRDKKPFSIIVPSIKWINKHTEYNKQFKKELNKLPGRKNIGIRIPNNWFSQELSKINIIFVTTSVNITGEKHMTNLKNINKGIIDKTGYIINEGTIDNKPSTIISLIKNKKIIRK